MALVLVAVVFACLVALAFWFDWDLEDVGYTIGGLLQGKSVRILKKFDKPTLLKMFRSEDKGNFLETNHAQTAWKPILSVESAGGEDWKKLRQALLPVMKHINWEERLKPIAAKWMNKSGDKKLDYHELCVIVAGIFYELVTGQDLPMEDLPKLMLGVEAWRVDLCAKAVGDHNAKLYVLDYMKEAVGKHTPLDKNDMYTMSSIMQPLFVSPLINIPDIFAVAEIHLKKLSPELLKEVQSDEKAAEAFGMECLRVGHPFPMVERNVDGGMFGSYQQVCRYDHFGKNEPDFDMRRWIPAEGKPKCPFEPMIFGAGPRVCQGKHLARALLQQMFMHYAKHVESFRPSEGHGVSGRTNDQKDSLQQQITQMTTIFRCFFRGAPLFAPLRFIGLSL